jgi:hypothetical protein
LFSLGALFVGVGITYCMRSIKYKAVKVFLALIVLNCLLLQAAVFFTGRLADGSHDLKQYLANHIYYFLQEHKQEFVSSRLMVSGHAYSVPICVAVSPDSSQLLNDNNIGVREQLDYFVPKGLDVHFIADANVGEAEAYIMKGACHAGKVGEKKYMKIIDCSSGFNFTCPLNFTDKIRIYSE